MGYTHGVQWDDEKIKREIIKVKDALKLNRMPTRGEMRAELGNDCLTFTYPICIFYNFQIIPDDQYAAVIQIG